MQDALQFSFLLRQVNPMTQQVSLGDAIHHLSRYVEAIERGEEITITRRGKPWRKWFGSRMAND
jgi:hypothetical protein